MTRSYCCTLTLLMLFGLTAVAPAAAGEREAVASEGVLVAQAKTKTTPKPAPKAAPKTATKSTKLSATAPPIDPAKPTVTVILASADEFFADIKWVFSLANAAQQYDTLTSTLELFLTGADRARPITARGYIVDGTLTYIASLPIDNAKDLKDFLTTAGDVGVKSKSLGKDEYELKELVEGFLRYNPTQKYAHLGERRGDVAVMTAPSPGLLKGYDLGALIDNRTQKPESRREVFVTLRKELLGGLKKTTKETEVEFELRKSAVEQQIDEIERFFVESLQIVLGWTTSVKDSQATLNIDLTAIPETSLAKSVSLLGATPDAFANVPRAANSVLSASVNFPIDEMRKGHLLQTSKLMRQFMTQKVDAQTDVKEDRKAIERDIVAQLWDIVDGIAKVEVYNGFIRSVPASEGTYTTVGGGRIADGQQVVKLIELIGAREGADSIKLNVDKVGEVSLHTVLLPETAAKYPELFTKDGLVHVGTSANSVWFALGDKGLDALKAAIEAAAMEAPADSAAGSTVVDLSAKLDPWVRILDRRLGKQGDVELRKMALDSFKSGNDTLTLQLKRVENDVRLQLQFNKSLIEFAGRVMAKFVKESLE